MNRKKLFLAFLLVLLPLTIFNSYLRMPRQKSVETLRFPQGAPPKKLNEVAIHRVDDKKLHLELLDREAQRFSGFRRNIFRPIFHDESKVLPSPVFIAPKPLLPVAMPQPLPPPVDVQSPVQQDMARFTFLGFMKKDNHKTIFLATGNEIFLVKKGDKIADKYEALNITDEALTITVLGAGGEIVIPLLENRPLVTQRQ
ncbi:MAG: hypothetical protein WA140_04370 [Geobacteraceae bacterium]